MTVFGVNQTNHKPRKTVNPEALTQFVHDNPSISESEALCILFNPTVQFKDKDKLKMPETSVFANGTKAAAAGTSGAANGSGVSVADKMGKMNKSLEIMKKRFKSPTAQSLASNLQSKIKAMVTGYFNKITSLNGQIANLQQSSTNSQDAIAKIQKQIDAIEKEASEKMKVISAIADKLPQLDGVFQDASKNNVPMDEITGFINGIISNISANPSAFSGEEKPEEIQEKMKKNIFGSNASGKFDDEEQKIKTQMQELRNSSISNQSPATGTTNSRPENPSGAGTNTNPKETAEIQINALQIKLDFIEEMKNSFKEMFK